MRIALLVASGTAALLAWLLLRGRGGREQHAETQPTLFTLGVDLPDLGLHRGERLVICPDDPIYLGDVVALKGDGGPVLARYRDEFIGSVAGRVRRADVIA